MGNDVIIGNEGDDTILADGGDDNILASNGNDVIWLGNGTDIIDGGPGIDTLNVGRWSKAFTISTNQSGIYTSSAHEQDDFKLYISRDEKYLDWNFFDQNSTSFPVQLNSTITNIEKFRFNANHTFLNSYTIDISKIYIEKEYSSEFKNYKFYNRGNGKYEINTDQHTGDFSVKTYYGTKSAYVRENNRGFDEITGIPTLKFSDKTICAVTDIQATFDQVTGLNTDSGEMFRLYNAAFSRFPDFNGLKYWIEQFSSGRNTRRVVAQSFLDSEEFIETYGSNVSNETYVNNLYKNVLGRDADTEGLNYWVSNLRNGIETRYEALLGFSESAENKALFTDMTGFG